VPGEVNMERALSLCRCILMVYLAVLVAVRAGAASPADAAPELEKVLDQMDSAAEKFHTTEAGVIWDQYQKIVDEH